MSDIDLSILKQTIEVDIGNKPAPRKGKDTYTVKIGRPNKKLAEKDPDKGSEHIAKLGDPDKVSEDYEFIASKFEDDEVIDVNDLSKLSKIKWKNFNVEKLVDLLCFISEKMVGTKLFPYQEIVQRRVFRSVLLNDGATLTQLFSRQSGKSFGASGTIPTLCAAMPALAKVFPEQLGIYSNGFWVGVFAPVASQAKNLYDRIIDVSRSERAQEVYDDSDIETGLERRKGRWKNGSFVIMQTARPGANIEGFSLHLILLEECQDMNESMILKSIDPMGAFYNATVHAIGTPSEKSSWFYEQIQLNKLSDLRNDEQYKTHFEYDYREVIKYNPRYKNHVDKKIRERGYEDRWFQMKYCLRWFFEEGRPINDSDMKKYMMYTKKNLIKYTGEPVVVGIDVAKERNGTVVTVGKQIKLKLQYQDDDEIQDGVQVCEWLYLEKKDYGEQRALIKSFLRGFSNIQSIIIDSTGVGIPFLESAREEWKDLCNHIDGYTFSAQSKNHLMNLFFEYYYKRRIIVPAEKEARLTQRWQNFYLQMLNLEQVKKNGYTQLCAPNRVGAHDDFADSLFLMVYANEISLNKYGEIETGNDKVFTQNRFPLHKKTLSSIGEELRSGIFNSRDSLRAQRASKLFKG